MQYWLVRRLEKLVRDLNEMPYTDDREEKQLELCKAMLRELNGDAMERAAKKARESINTMHIPIEKDDLDFNV